MSTSTTSASPKAPRTSILGKGKASNNALASSATPTPLKDTELQKPLSSLQDTYGEALRVYMSADHVRRVLTGSDAPFVSAAAYDALQRVCRARSAGLTVVELGAQTQYDQKTVYYLVKTLVERHLVVKFAAPEMGHVSNYVVAKRYLADNPQWRAQQAAEAPSTASDNPDASSAVGEPTLVDVERLSAMAAMDAADEAEDVSETTASASTAPTASLALPPALDPHDHAMLAFPLLSEEQSSVWLHSRQALLTKRLIRLLQASTSHMTPRRFLEVRLGLRRVPTLRRGFLAFLNRHIASGLIERVRVQFPSTTPLYIRLTERSSDTPSDTHAPSLPSGDATPTTMACTWDAPLEAQLLRHIDETGASGCTMQELAEKFAFSAEVKRMVEHILARQVPSGAPPYPALAICAPFEQAGRERRIRYYTARGFEAHCQAEGLSMTTALGITGGTAPSSVSWIAVPAWLPGEAFFASADELQDTMQRVQQNTIGFFRDKAGPVSLRPPKRKAPIDPTTGKAKRGRPRKNAPRPSEPTPEPVTEKPEEEPDTKQEDTSMAIDPAVTEGWQVFQPVATRSSDTRANLSAFQRSTLLAHVVEFAGGALDDIDVPRRTRAYLASQANSDANTQAGGDLADRSTRTKAIAHAERRGLLRTLKVARPDDGQKPRTILHLASLQGAALQSAVEAAFTTTESRGVVTHDDVLASHAGLAAPALPPTMPWADSTPIVYGKDDPLDDPATQHAFAKHTHVLRQYYGFAHGSAARLMLFLDSAWTAAHTDGTFSLQWFVTESPLTTFVALVPVRLRSPSVVRAVTQARTTTCVQDVPPSVARRLGLSPTRTPTARLATYAQQLCELGLCTPVAHEEEDKAPTWRLVTSVPHPDEPATPLSLSTHEARAAYWATLRAHIERDRSSSLAKPYLTAPHAWQTDFLLRGIQKAFLRRYTLPGGARPPSEAYERVGHVVFAPTSVIEAYFEARSRTGPSATETIARKVEARRAARATEWANAWAAVCAERPLPSEIPRAVSQLEERYVASREAWAPALLQQRLTRALQGGSTAHRTPGERIRVRRSRRAIQWTAAHQVRLCHAYVILRERQRAWHAWHLSQGAPPPPDDWSALAQLVDDDGEDGDAPSAWTTWRVRRQQLSRSPPMLSRLASVERVWHRFAQEARRDGRLVDPHWPHPSSLDLKAHLSLFEANIDADEIAKAHAKAVARIVLPLTWTERDAEAWVSTAEAIPPLSWPSESAPMVHRLEALRQRAWTMRMLPSAVASLPILSSIATACVHMLVTRPLSRDAMRQWTQAGTAAFPQALESAMDAMLSQRIVRWLDDMLVYTDEYVRAWTSAWPMADDAYAAYVQASQQTSITAHPAASDGATAAWIAMLEAGEVHPTLDMGPLHALRRRTKLNARTLDDIETECLVTLTPTSAMPHGNTSLPAPPCGPAPTFETWNPDAVPPAWTTCLEEAGAEGVCVSSLDVTWLAQHPIPTSVLRLGYDTPRLVHPKFVEAWSCASLDMSTAQQRVWPRPWYDAYGTLHTKVWQQRYVSVLAYIHQHPGVTLATLHTSMAPWLDRLALLDVVHVAVKEKAVQVLVNPSTSLDWDVTAPEDVALHPGAARALWTAQVTVSA